MVDFDITQEANGVGIPVKKNFTATVKDKILEIRFQYTGKGTSFAGKYGPLISAISVEPGKQSLPDLYCYTLCIRP